MQKVNVLVFPCGSENASEIYHALRYSVHVNIFGASSVDDFGRFRYENYFGRLPNITDANFDEVFSQLISELEIDVVFSTHDTVAEYLSTRAKSMDFFLVNGDANTSQIARRKSLTYELFSHCDWCPTVFHSADEVQNWPIIVKPDLGQGAQGITLVKNRKELDTAIRKVREPVLVEYLPGEELTIDCFSDRNKNLIWVGPRTRERVKAGITMRSKFIEPCEEIMDIANTINELLILRGPWFFQIKRCVNGKWKLLEISVRIAGTMVAQRARGINLPLMAIQDYLERDLIALPITNVELIERNIATKRELNYSFNIVYIDLDETLIIDGYAVPMVIAFLLQMKKEEKELILITRHEYNVSETLKNAFISPDIFSEIIHITDKTLKSKYIVKKNAIFIDNHFPERLDVHKNCKIPVFDVDAIEFFVS